MLGRRDAVVAVGHDLPATPARHALRERGADLGEHERRVPGDELEHVDDLDRRRGLLGRRVVRRDDHRRAVVHEADVATDGEHRAGPGRARELVRLGGGALDLGLGEEERGALRWEDGAKLALGVRRVALVLLGDDLEDVRLDAQRHGGRVGREARVRVLPLVLAVQVVEQARADEGRGAHDHLPARDDARVRGLEDVDVVDRVPLRVEEVGFVDAAAQQAARAAALAALADGAHGDLDHASVVATEPDASVVLARDGAAQAGGVDEALHVVELLRREVDVGGDDQGNAHLALRQLADVHRERQVEHPQRAHDVGLARAPAADGRDDAPLPLADSLDVAEDLSRELALLADEVFRLDAIERDLREDLLAGLELDAAPAREPHERDVDGAGPAPLLLRRRGPPRGRQPALRPRARTPGGHLSSRPAAAPAVARPARRWLGVAPRLGVAAPARASRGHPDAGPRAPRCACRASP